MSIERTLTLGWNYGLLGVERFGGRLGPVLFILPDGRQVAPLSIAPWFGEEIDLSRQPLFHRLRGEWPCVPFGFDRDRPATQDWPSGSVGSCVDVGHGYGSSHEWELLEHSTTRVSLAIAYPAGHPIARLERTICPVPDRPAIDLHLSVEVRSDCRLPIGLHPTLAAPKADGRWFIDLDPRTIVATYPYQPDPLSIITPGLFVPIGAVPGTDGSIIDARYFPPKRRAEDLLQVLEANGSVGLLNSSENYRLGLSWVRDHFPSLLLWISNRALTAPLGIRASRLWVSSPYAPRSISAVGCPRRTIRLAGVA
ncbi:hypothetical protein G5V57_17365 [Nordella sp. HKS 07]|uniref:hypothetical protein n=1 Tax=Nordella sp. HKS 07 TaxID=2712222 RepID=UPI0013E18232|nr:hypothetical protein [Nordella sp. HKS 07]QIG49335.1 hypothetical protein G5V57_17365 [Nordella sp. HKS 07]